MLAHVVETARTYQARSDVIADKDTLQLCSDVDVPMLMNAVVADETHADQTNNVKTLQEASSVVATGKKDHISLESQIGCNHATRDTTFYEETLKTLFTLHFNFASILQWIQHGITRRWMR